MDQPTLAVFLVGYARRGQNGLFGWKSQPIPVKNSMLNGLIILSE